MCRRRASFWVGRLLFLPGLAGGRAVCGSQATLLEADLGHSSRPPPSPGLAPPVPWHQSRQRRRSQNPLQAGGKGDMDGEEVATRHETRGVPRFTPRLPSGRSPSAPLGRRTPSHSHCPL